MIIDILGVDMALSNCGFAEMQYNTETKSLKLESLTLVKTDRMVNKSIRQNSDDLRRAKELQSEFIKMTSGKRIVFSEIPTGAQSARAMFSFGVVLGVLASCPIPLIQVQPFETKLATVGTKTASKEEMIEWAGLEYPKANWIRQKRNGKNFKIGDLSNDNEHLADACAVAHAGINTDQFKGMMALL